MVAFSHRAAPNEVLTLWLYQSSIYDSAENSYPGILPTLIDEGKIPGL